MKSLSYDGTNKHNMRANKEYQICKAITQYLRLQYPSVMFHWDLAGLNLSRAQAGMMKAIQGQRGYPDLFIAKESHGFHGLFLEIKAITPFLKNGMTLKSDKHLQEQDSNHKKLRWDGYWAEFVTGFDEAKTVIDHYLNT